MDGAEHLGSGIMSLSLRALILYGSHWTNGRNGTMAEVTDHAGKMPTGSSEQKLGLGEPAAAPPRGCTPLSL
ncbi:hypothetical protein CGCA056_v008639 [Colletotrichum aenigma]|uniref:uncharacterized protein n=1 Tax=Colletotrichum aenigma TaxID=1215731 RepID=UPI001872D149|nr:uncharacterized protein CGCA056_v008639 [Colletotrichum aenigma]KAF5520755.1 hypothetical protein CGCA056_v008639 [Colletotrichum aenigma]